MCLVIWHLNGYIDKYGLNAFAKCLKVRVWRRLQWRRRQQEQKKTGVWSWNLTVRNAAICLNHILHTTFNCMESYFIASHLIFHDQLWPLMNPDRSNLSSSYKLSRWVCFSKFCIWCVGLLNDLNKVNDCRDRLKPDKSQNKVGKTNKQNGNPSFCAWRHEVYWLHFTE